MIVTLVASTEIREFPASVQNTRFGTSAEAGEYAWHYEDIPKDADTLAHFAGRSCYQAWDMPNPATANDMGYLANIIKQGHFSVLEHSSATFYIEGVSRNLTHELIRHRHLSYSELSQRFVNMADAKWIVPPALKIDGTESSISLRSLGDGAHYGDDHPYSNYTATVDTLMEEGYTRKQAREAARFYLPSGMETKIVVSGNHRAWRDMLQKRYSVHADAEIRELSSILLAKLREIAPATYQDFPDTPFE
jgi:thymidylate synthase (FAD)